MKPINSRTRQTAALAPMLGVMFSLILLTAATATSANGVSSLVSLGGLVIVFGGMSTTAFMSFPAEDVRQAIRAIVAMLKGVAADPLHDDLRRDLEEIVGWARIGYEKGTRGLERGLPGQGVPDPLMRYGLNLVVSDYTEPDVRAMMKTAADLNYERGCIPVDVLRGMSSHAPAFGMVGTLVGMVSMLHDLQDNAGAIGAALAIAFLCTLYGVLAARMITMPAASWLEQQVERRRLRDELIAEAMALLACRKPPTFVRDRLNGFLPPPAHNYFSVIGRTDDAGSDRRAIQSELDRKLQLLPSLRVIKG